MLNKYMYIINYNQDESKMAQMELKCLFDEKVMHKTHFSNTDIDIERSIFIKRKLETLEICSTFEELLATLNTKEYYFDDYKVEYMENFDYQFSGKSGLELSKALGYAILGDFNMQNPKINLAFSVHDDKWYFGIATKSSQNWHLHDNKPHNFSNSLSVRVAHTLVNIAIGNDFTLKVCDPCCGVGTVLLEALKQGVNIDGYDISYPNSENARQNVAFYNYKCDINCSDIKDITKTYDVMIVDLPYGVFTVISYDQQMAILKNAYLKSNKLILITHVEMEDELSKLSYRNIEMSYVIKARFKRYIYIAYK